MTSPYRTPIPQPPRSRVRAVEPERPPALPSMDEHRRATAAEIAPLRARAARVSDDAAAMVRDLRATANERVEAAGRHEHWATLEHAVAARYEAEARALEDAEEELRWYASLAP